MWCVGIKCVFMLFWCGVNGSVAVIYLCILMCVEVGFINNYYDDTRTSKCESDLTWYLTHLLYTQFHGKEESMQCIIINKLAQFQPHVLLREHLQHTKSNKFIFKTSTKISFLFSVTCFIYWKVYWKKCGFLVSHLISNACQGKIKKQFRWKDYILYLRPSGNTNRLLARTKVPDHHVYSLRVSQMPLDQSVYPAAWYN